MPSRRSSSYIDLQELELEECPREVVGIGTFSPVGNSPKWWLKSKGIFPLPNLLNSGLGSIGICP